MNLLKKALTENVGAFLFAYFCIFMQIFCILFTLLKFLQTFQCAAVFLRFWLSSGQVQKLPYYMRFSVISAYNLRQNTAESTYFCTFQPIYHTACMCACSCVFMRVKCLLLRRIFSENIHTK